MDDKTNNWNAFTNTLSMIANLAVAVCAIMSVNYLYTQTPMFEGARPKLTYWVHYGNTNKRDEEQHYKTTGQLLIKNDSRYPAKDVYVIIRTLRDGKEFTAKSAHHFELLPQTDAARRAVLFKSIPVGAIVSLEWSHKLYQFKGRKRLNFFDDNPYETTGFDINYFNLVEQIYNDFGPVNELKHKSTARESMVPEDECSEESKAQTEKNRKEYEEKEAKENPDKPPRLFK